MLIQRLVEFARVNNVIGDPLYERKPVRWLVNIGADGNFLGFIDTSNDGRHGREYLIPKKAGANAGGVAAFGVDNPRFVLAYEVSGGRSPASLLAEREAFAELIRQAGAENPSPALSAAREFYARGDQLDAARKAAAEHRVSDGDRLALAYSADRGVPLFETPQGRAFWAAHRARQQATVKRESDSECLGCGQVSTPVQTADKVQVPGGQPSGSALVSFDKDAFCSYGWEKNVNAAVCEPCSVGYTRALGHLLRRDNTPRTRVDVGGTAFLIWQSGGAVGEILALLTEPASDDAVALLSSIRSGRPPDVPPGDRLYALGIRGNGGRVAVVEWFETSLAEAYENIGRWFSDLEIRLLFDEREKGETLRMAGELSRPPGIWALRRATVAAEDDENPRTQVALLRAALRGDPVPIDVAAACIRRLPLDGFGDYFAPARLGLIRATLNRHARVSGGKEKELSAGIDTENSDPAYLCGRLFATLEAVQYAAVGDVGANIVDRYYGKASTAPGVAFGPLMTLAQSHLGSVRNPGQAVNLDRELQEIASRLGPAFPKTFSLEEQGRFAIGYYHQKAYRFAEIRRRREERGATSEQEETE